MSNIFYESLGRATWWGYKKTAKRTLSQNRARFGAIAALAVGVVAVGAVMARSHAPAE